MKCLSLTGLLIASFALPALTSADVFKYVDKNGTIVFVDDENKIPSKYRKKARITSHDSPEDPRSTQVKVIKGKVLIPVKLTHGPNTVHAWLAMDTGANVTTISFEVANRLGIPSSTLREGRATVADGRTVTAYSTTLSSVAVGNKSKFNMRISILPGAGSIHYDGLLGLDFLGDFRHTLDIGQQRINWL